MVAAEITLDIIVIAFNKHLLYRAEPGFVFGQGHRQLIVHNNLAAVGAKLLINLVGEICGGCAFFLGISKATKTVKLRFLYKLAKLLELLLGFAGKTGYQRCSDGDVGQFCANLFKKFFKRSSVTPTVHSAKHLGVAMLNGNIKIFNEFFFTCYRFEQLVVNQIGVGIKRSYPFDSLYPAKLFE